MGLTALTRTTLGKKYLMAITGIVLFAYVLVHMLANLQVFLGPAPINRYAEMLHRAPLLLWGARAVLGFSVAVHIVAAAQLAVRNWSARPIGYRVRRYRDADYAARTMVWSGPILAAFVAYHLADLTVGSVHPAFRPGDVYHNVVTSFSRPVVAGLYLAAVALLGFHLFHGLWSLFQTLGASHPSFDRSRRVLALVLALAIGVGFAAVPFAVLTGILS